MDVAAHLDPEIAAALGAMAEAGAETPAMTAERLPEMRAGIRMLVDMTEVDPARCRDVVAPARDGQPDVSLRVYSPTASGTARPCIFYIHGGGYLFGAAGFPESPLLDWTDVFDCVAVSVEYRFAPEDPYPAALEDCYHGLVWVAQHADELGIDPGRIVIAGESAGGGLCAALALLARDRGEVTPSFQLLIAPMIDDRNITVSSHIADAPVWSQEANRFAWESYLGPDLKPGSDAVPPYAAVARVDDLRGLPPTFIGVGTVDLFRDEDIAYAQRLLCAEVATELHVYPGAPHGFLILAADSAVAGRARADIVDALRRALRPERVTT